MYDIESHLYRLKAGEFDFVVWFGVVARQEVEHFTIVL